jgi:hypothetical protein
MQDARTVLEVHSHWRAQCIERCPLGSEGGCAEKARTHTGNGTSPRSPPCHVSGHPRPGCHRQTGHWSPRSNSVRGSSAHPCLAAADSRRGVAKLARMRRILLGAVAGVLLLAVGTRAADALGIGGPRLRCGCTETCWCKRPGLTVLRWVTPGRWHHIGLTAEEKQSHHSQA